VLLRLVGLSTLLLAVSPLGRGCAPATSGSAPVVVAEPTPEPTPEPSTPAPPARASLRPEALGPALAATPQGARGLVLTAALSALSDGRYADVIAALPASGGGPIGALEDWTRSQALRALDRDAEADPVLAQIPMESRYGLRAVLARAEIALDASRPQDALDLLAALPVTTAYNGETARADLLTARGLRARAQEGDLAAAHAAALRVWRGMPGSQSDADAEALMDALEPSLPAASRRGLSDAVGRSQAWGRRSGKKSIVKLLHDERGALIDLGATNPTVACSGLFELGRAWHKQRKYSESVPVLREADRLCTGEEHVKTLYLLAQGQARSGQVRSGITTFLRLPDEYPAHSYADDGLWQASRLALDEGRNDEAATHAQRLITSFPDGDMRGSTLWNLAWSAIADGRPADALPWLETMGAGDPQGADREHVLQGRYWTARVLLSTAPERRSEALDSLGTLAIEQPLHWYGTLAGWLLQQEDGARSAKASAALVAQAKLMRAAPAEPAVFTPLQEFVDDPGVSAGMAFLVVGLAQEAAEELGGALGLDAHTRWPDPATLVFAAHLLEEAGDPARSHNLLRRAYKSHFPATSQAQASMLKHAWPRAFSNEITMHTSSYSWDSMLFQGLVREESAFSPAVVSWAGAIGLSQLMWPTAKETARRMGIRVRRADLNDPSLNVHIGTTYFEGLAQRWQGHLPLAVASYNAGPGAVNKWVKARGHLDLDAWVETIPYDQTRHYVKRVVSSWQAYKFLYGEGDSWVPLRVGPVADGIAAADPSAPRGSGGG